MSEVSKSQRIREFVLNNPGRTTKDIAHSLSYTPASVATVLHVEFERKFDRQPFYPMVLTREEGGRTLSNVPYYRWMYKDVGEVSGRPPYTRARAAPKPCETVLPSAGFVPPKKIAVLPTSEADASPTNPIQSAIDTLVGSIVAAIKPQLHAAIAEAIQATAAPQRIEYKQPETPMLPAPQPATRLPRVVITGLLPYQAGQIATEFGSSLEVSCWDGGSHSQLAAMAKQADAVFNHTKHGGHATESTLKTIGANLIRVSGGMTSMRQALRTFIEKGQEAGR